MTDWKRAAPYLITPDTEIEARLGKPTLLTDGDILVLLIALEHRDFELYCGSLRAKLERLRDH